MVGTQLSCVAAGIRVPMADHQLPQNPLLLKAEKPNCFWAEKPDGPVLTPRAPLFFPVKVLCKTRLQYGVETMGGQLLNQRSRTPFYH